MMAPEQLNRMGGLSGQTIKMRGLPFRVTIQEVLFPGCLPAARISGRTPLARAARHSQILAFFNGFNV